MSILKHEKNIKIFEIRFINNLKFWRQLWNK